MTNNNMVTTICYKVKTPVTYKSGRTVETFLACYSKPEIAEQRVKELNEDKTKAKEFCEYLRIPYEVEYFFINVQERFY